MELADGRWPYLLTASMLQADSSRPSASSPRYSSTPTSSASIAIGKYIHEFQNKEDAEQFVQDDEGQARPHPL